MDYFKNNLASIHDDLVNKKYSVEELTKSTFDNIKKVDKEIEAFLKLDEERALEKARKIDERGVKADSILDGIGIGIKDNIVTKDLTTTAASKMLENFISPYDATVMENINKEKMVTIGKLNMDEFAMGASTEYSAFQKTSNPWDITRVPGGSSGGSAAAVAADLVPWALGSDTGGSIRQPAAFCGVVGLKPTYGLVSRYGLVAFASSLDQIGPITKDVTDCAMLLNVIAGQDEKDTTSVEQEKKDYTKALKKDVKGLKIGLPKEYFGEGINKEVKESVLAAAKKLEEMGATIEECSLDIAQYALATYYIIACAEASSNLGRFDGIRYRVSCKKL